MSLLALRIAQVIHEYSSSGVIGRAIRRDFSSLHSRIEKYQADHNELMEQFKTRLGINVDIQVERLYQMVLELKTTGAGPTASSSVQLFRPIATTRFVGRRAELERLRDHFKKTEAQVARRSFLLHGMGGIGKTQLCLHFVEDAVDSGLVFFIDAATEDSIVSSLKSIFQNTAELKSSGQAESPVSVLNWISGLEEDWLVVYENAEDFVSKYLPPGRKGNVLMTSRNPDLARHTGGSHIPLDEMSEEDALALFKSSGCHDFLSPEDEVLCRQIISSLSFIPLAVDLAGAYTASSTGFCDFREYLDLLSLQRNQLFDSFSYSIAESTPYHNTVYGAWELSMKAIEARASSSHPQQEASQSAITILQIFSFLHHSNIDENMFKRSAVGYFARSDDLQDAFFQPPPLSPEAERIIKLDNTRSDWDANHFRKGINVLLSASLIKRSPDKKIYSVHPLIHEWIRNRNSTPKQSSILKDVHVIMLSSVSFDVTQYYPSVVSLIPHIKAYQQYAHCGTDMHGSYNDYMHERLQFVYQKAGLYQEEKQILLRMVECRKDKLGLKHPKTLYSMRTMATWYRKQFQRDEALSTLGDVIPLMKEVYGERHQITLDTMRELGWVHLVKDEYEEAEKIDTAVLKLQVEMLGKKHRDTLETMNDLSMVYAKQRHYEKSKTLLDETIDLSKELLGEDHPDALERLDNLASTLCYQNKWKEGIDILVPLLETKKRVQGEEHPNTLYDIHQLACCYSNVGEIAKAEDMYLSAIKVKEKVLGEEHPSTMSSKSNLAVMYANRQRMDEAIRILEPLIVTSERVEQEEPPILISCMETLAYCLEVKGKIEEAENLYQKTIKLSVKIHGENHPRTYEMKQVLATLYTGEARWKEAETVLVSLLESQRNFLGTQHEDTLYTESSLDRVQSRLRGSPIDSEFASSGEDDDWTETSNTDDENSDIKGVEEESAAEGEKAMVFKADV
ncbi:TPR-like protein [Agrocybe pediades]|nr:TPR-like protein [Agrocybe pediades]